MHILDLQVTQPQKINISYELIASQVKSNDKYTGQCIIYKQTKNVHITIKE